MRTQAAIVLHAHLPFADPDSLEERWAFEAVLECYLPLVDLLRRLEHEGVPTPLTLSVSPTLMALLDAEAFRDRFGQHLDALEAFLDTEGPRLSADYAHLPGYYRSRVSAQRTLWNALDRSIVTELHRLAKRGAITLCTTALTHAYLPAWLPFPQATKLQVQLAQATFARRFNEPSQGFFLPECGYTPAIGALLGAQGIRYSFVESHGIERSTPASPFGCLAPILTPAGVVLFGRDPVTAERVWSREVGYPRASCYRDFHSDAGWNAPKADLGILASAGGHTGIKYHRITGDGEKAPYEPSATTKQLTIDAEDFLRAVQQAPQGAWSWPAPPLRTCIYDAELFGHWWHEGPSFLEQVFRQNEKARTLTTHEAFLRDFPLVVEAEAAPSSWGKGGDSRVWVGPRSAGWLRRTHAGWKRWVAQAPACAPDDANEALTHALLAQASDNLFMIELGQTPDTGKARMCNALEAMDGWLSRAGTPSRPPPPKSAFAPYCSGAFPR